MVDWWRRTLTSGSNSGVIPLLPRGTPDFHDAASAGAAGAGNFTGVDLGAGFVGVVIRLEVEDVEVVAGWVVEDGGAAINTGTRPEVGLVESTGSVDLAAEMAGDTEVI